MIDIDPYELCPCGSQKKYKFCCKVPVDRALELVRMGKEWEAEKFFGVPLLTKWVENDSNPQRQQDLKEILSDRLKYGPAENPA